MIKNRKNLKPKVFFNASVLLSGINSPKGGSGLLLQWVKRNKINGIISELVLDEAMNNSIRIDFSPSVVEKKISSLFKVNEAPERLLEKYKKLVRDMGDVHLFTSCEENDVDYLVSLDKKHVLSLKDKVKKFKIVSPGELIRILH